MSYWRMRETLRRIVLAVALLALITPSEAGIFSSIFGKRNSEQAAGTSAAENPAAAQSGERQAPNDLFAQQTRNVVEEVAETIGKSSDRQGAPTATDQPNEGSSTLRGKVGSSAHKTTDPGLGDHVEPSDRQTTDTPHDVAKSDKSVVNPELNEMDGNSDRLSTQANETQLSENEASEMIATEIDDSDKPIGPDAYRSNLENSSKTSVETHIALKSQFETALASLKSVFSVLLRTGGHESTVDERADASVDPVSVRNPVAVAVRNTPASTGKSPGEAVGNGIQNAVTDHELSLQTPPLLPGSSSSPAKAESQSASAGQAASPNGVDTVERPAGNLEKPQLAEAGESDGFATAVLSAFAGLLFVAAVGLMVAGFAHSSRENEMDTESPLYPPRGPNFV